MKIKSIFLFALSLILFSNCKDEEKIKEIQKISFVWEDGEIDGRAFEKVAMNIPIRIENIPANFYMQLDLGAINVIDENVIKQYMSVDTVLARKLNADFNRDFKGRKCNTFENVNVMLDSISLATSFLNLVGFGEVLHPDSLYTPTPKRLGTIGVDMFDGKILIIDYPDQELSIVDRLEDSASYEYVDFLFENGRIKIPVEVNGKTEYLLYDSGSSMFTLITSAHSWKELADTSATVLDSIQINAWGESKTIYWAPCSGKMKIGSIVRQNFNVYYGENWIDSFLEKENLYGVTGNKIFLDKTIAIDFSQKRFYISK